MYSFPTSRLKPSLQFLYVGIIVFSVAGLCYLFGGGNWFRVVALILLMTVSLIAMFFEIFPVLTAALLSALIWDYFFIPPRFTFQVHTTEDFLFLLMYFVIASLNAVLTYKLRQIEKIEREKEEKAKTINLYSNLLNSLSHELKTPIATIIGSTDNLLSEETKLNATQQQSLLHQVSDAALRLNQQVENLLNMSRLDSGQLTLKKYWCDMNELVYSVINQLEEQLKSHQLQVEIREQLPLFKLDIGLMQEVLRNLLSNAIIYTPLNSLIKIKVDYNAELMGYFTDSANDLESHPNRISNRLVIEISDSGKGFPEDEKDKVFSKFYRLKHTAAGGTGLGLSIVKGFVEAHQGNIYLSNLAGGGARFTIEIPALTSFLSYQKNE